MPKIKLLPIGDTWAIAYDAAANDRPLYWLRYGEKHSKWEENNATTALFYSLLEATEGESHGQ